MKIRHKISTMLVILITGFTFAFGFLESNAEELYFEVDFDFEEKSGEDKRYILGDIVTIIGYSSFYKEDTDEHFPAPDSNFHVIIKDPRGEVILEEDYISDSKGKIQFSFQISKNYPMGQYNVEMIINKQKHLDLPFFVGSSPEDIVKHDGKFDLWMSDSEVVMLSDTDVTGIFCSDLLKVEKERELAFLDPRDGDLFEKHSVKFRATHTDPSGITIQTSSTPEKAPCTDFAVHSPTLNVAETWSIFVTALWEDDEVLYEATSNTMTFQVKEPLFRGIVDKISLDKPSWGDIKSLDWSPDGKFILFTYLLPISDKFHSPRLAIMFPDGTNIMTLDIPMLLEFDNRIDLARFSPDGKFIHFNAYD